MTWLLWTAAVLVAVFAASGLGLLFARYRQQSGYATSQRHRLEIERDTFRRIEAERMREREAAGAPIWRPKA